MRDHEPERYARIAHVLLPKDYVRLRLTGEHATDVADASGTLLFDVAAPALERRRCCDALEVDAGVAAARARVATRSRGERRRRPGRGGRRRPGGRRARRRDRRAGRPLSVVLGTSGVVFAALGSSRPTPRPASTPSATPSPAPGTRWA